MPYEAKKQKCKKEDGSSGTHTIYKKGTSEKVGCTSDPSGYMAKLYSVEESTNKDKQMNISRKELKEIIKEHLDEGMFDSVSAMNEEQVEVTDVKTLIALLNVRSGQDEEDLGASRTEARLSPREADQAVALLRQLSEGT